MKSFITLGPGLHFPGMTPKFKSVIKAVIPFQKNPKNLEKSYKMDVDLLALF